MAKYKPGDYLIDTEQHPIAVMRIIRISGYYYDLEYADDYSEIRVYINRLDNDQFINPINETMARLLYT